MQERNLKKTQRIIDDRADETIKSILNRGDRAEIANTKDGIVVRRVKRETVYFSGGEHGGGKATGG